MATQEKFVATHRFTGADKLVFFRIGEPVVRLRDSDIPDNGVYQSEDGTLQHVEDTSVELIETKPAAKEQK